MSRKPKITFEGSLDFIDKEIEKRRGKWSLSSLNWLDFDDVAQIVRIHIFVKWKMYDQSKALGPWLNTIISNQIKNLIRNNYANFSRPCLKCEASDGEDGCKIYQIQCAACPLYKFWEKNKKAALDLKIPVPIPNDHSPAYHDSMSLESMMKALEEKLPTILRPAELEVYNYLYIERLSEEQVAIKMGYRTSEKKRSPGYRQIKNIQKSIINKIKKAISSGKIDIY